MRYFWNLVTALNQLLNTILLGDPDEVMSSRAAKNQHKWHWRMLGHILEWIDPGHLEKYREDDEGKNSLTD